MRVKRFYKMLFVIIIIFILILMLNNRTMYISDDFLYRFEFTDRVTPDTELNSVQGIESLIKSQYNHYHVWNGRFVAHTIIQFFMQFNKWIFNLLNAFAFIVLGWLIARIGSFISEVKVNYIILTLVYILLFLSIPAFGQTVLWISGAANYLWMSIIYLSFFYFNIRDNNNRWNNILLSIVLGFLAGATNENTGSATILMVILLSFYQFYREKKISLWRLCGILSSILGFSLILFAPAATKRVEQRNEVSVTIYSFVEGIDSIIQYIIENHLNHFIVIIVLLIVLYTNNKLDEKKVVNIVVLFIGYLGSIFSLAVVNTIIERTMFGPVVFLITISIILIMEFFKYIDNSKVIKLGLIPIILLFIYVYLDAFNDISSTHNEIEEQYEVLTNNANEDVEIPMITQPETDYNAYSSGTNYLQKNKDAWLNRWASKFFGVNSISGYEK